METTGIGDGSGGSSHELIRPWMPRGIGAGHRERKGSTAGGTGALA